MDVIVWREHVRGCRCKVHGQTWMCNRGQHLCVHPGYSYMVQKHGFVVLSAPTTWHKARSGCRHLRLDSRGTWPVPSCCAEVMMWLLLMGVGAAWTTVPIVRVAAMLVIWRTIWLPAAILRSHVRVMDFTCV